MTNPLPPGTCNRAWNFSTLERTLWDKVAHKWGESWNQTTQELALDGLSRIDPELAAEIAKVRKQRGIQVRLKVASTLGAIAILFASFAMDIKRVCRRPSGRRNDTEMFAEALEPVEVIADSDAAPMVLATIFEAEITFIEEAV